VHRDVIVGFDITRDVFSSHARVTNLSFRIFGIDPEHVERHLAVH